MLTQKKQWTPAALMALALLLAAGCGDQNVKQKASAPESTATGTADKIDGANYLLITEPSGAAEVIAARKTAQNDEEIVIVGRIGGDMNPWVDDLAAFTIVDNSLKACSDIEGDNCPYPWDYCCQTDLLPTSTALVKIVDAQGQLVKADARQLLDLKELQTVVVRGKAERDEAGNLTVNATGVYVKQ